MIHQTRRTLFQTVAIIFSIQMLFQNFLIYDLLNILSLDSLLLFSQVVFLLFLHVDFDNLTIYLVRSSSFNVIGNIIKNFKLDANRNHELKNSRLRLIVLFIIMIILSNRAKVSYLNILLVASSHCCKAIFVLQRHFRLCWLPREM